jgi:uncharacterized protein YndB with AHSA1/START domain
MPAPRISVTHEFTKPVDRVFDFLAEHENLGTIFGPAKVTRLNDGTDGTRNGVGSARTLVMGPGVKLVETNTVVVPNERIEYEITKSSLPVKHHHGTMVFSSLPSGGSRLVYDIELELPIPGASAGVAKILNASITRGLKKVDALA